MASSIKPFNLPFVLIFGLLYINALAISNCPDGFKYSADGIPKCYSVVTQRLNWDAAQAKCRQLNSKAHLVVINSALENQIVQEMLNDFDCAGTPTDEHGHTFHRDDFWAGGRRLTDSCGSSFVWKAGTGQAASMAYADWIPGEPSCHGRNEFCLAVVKTVNSRWNDYACYERFCAVCEVVKLQR